MKNLQESGKHRQNKLYNISKNQQNGGNNLHKNIKTDKKKKKTINRLDNCLNNMTKLTTTKIDKFEKTKM